MPLDTDGLFDRMLIRERYGRYALAVAQQDADAWLACWSADATWKTSLFEVSGQAALQQMWAATWINFDKVAAFNEVGEIVVSGDNATAKSAVYEIMTLKSGALHKMAGVYTDEFVREGGVWRFSRREYALISQETAA
ncbi:MAG: nuclear transport factor 2 family protein [Burkholderiales bacterium]